MVAIIAMIYSIIYYFSVRNTPQGATYFKPKKMGAMEVTSVGDLWLYILITAPMYIALAVLNWKLSAQMHWFNDTVAMAIYAGLLALYLYQAWKIFQINRSVFHTPVPELQRYSFKQVIVLNFAYMLTFGTELAVVSMLPLMYMDMFNVSFINAGLLAAIYPVLNLFARPAGGWLSDIVGRKLTLGMVPLGLACSFLVLGQLNSEWALSTVVALTIIGGIFSKSGSGAVYAVVPLIQRRMTGQIAGMAGAYGNVGGLAFLTVLSFVPTHLFFTVIGFTGLFVFACVVLMLKEPKGAMVEVLPDGTVQMIDVK
jgi:NNP family nitrate/nitrite transporter-like MFS transporter